MYCVLAIKEENVQDSIRQSNILVNAKQLTKTNSYKDKYFKFKILEIPKNIAFIYNNKKRISIPENYLFPISTSLFPEENKIETIVYANISNKEEMRALNLLKNILNIQIFYNLVMEIYDDFNFTDLDIINELCKDYKDINLHYNVNDKNLVEKIVNDNLEILYKEKNQEFISYDFEKTDLIQKVLFRIYRMSFEVGNKRTCDDIDEKANRLFLKLFGVIY